MYIDEANDGEVVAVTKRNIEGEPLPKQLKLHEEVSVSRLLNPPGPLVVQRRVLHPRKGPMRSYQKKKSKKKSKKTSLQEPFGRYNFIHELAKASSGLSSGKIFRGDASVAEKEIGRLFAKQGGRGRVFAGHADMKLGRMHLVTFQVYGTEAEALLDSGPCPISSRPS